MASFVAPFLFYYLRLHALYIFLPGVIISSLAQWQISTHGDALLGLSGGICAMLGAALVLCIRKTLFFPKGLPLQVGGIAFLSIIGAQAFAPDSATVAHLAGYVFGIGVTIFIRLEKIQN